MRFSPSEIEKITEGPMAGAWYRKNRGWWYADFVYVYPDGRRERITKKSPVNSKRGAEKYSKQLAEAIASGEYKKTEPTKFKDFAADFIVWARVNRKPTVVREYERVLRTYLIPAFGPRYLGTIKQKQIESFKAEQLKTHLSKKSINNNLALLSRVLRLAEEWGQLGHAPRVRLLKIPRTQDSEYRWLSREDAAKLIAQTEGRLKAMVMVAINTGLRLGELEALHWDDVDLKAQKITVRRSFALGEITTPKSGKGREVALNTTACAALSGFPKRLRCPLVFSTASGKVVDKPDLSRELRRACRKAGLEPIGWHVLRHTFGTWLAEAGVPLRQVQELMGHSTIKMTERYAHVAPSSLMEAVRVLEG